MNAAASPHQQKETFPPSIPQWYKHHIKNNINSQTNLWYHNRKSGKERENRAGFSIKRRFFVCYRNGKTWMTLMFREGILSLKVSGRFACKQRREASALSFSLSSLFIEGRQMFGVTESSWHRATTSRFISAHSPALNEHTWCGLVWFFFPGFLISLVRAIGGLPDVNTARRFFYERGKNCGQKEKPPVLPHRTFFSRSLHTFVGRCTSRCNLEASRVRSLFIITHSVCVRI